MKYAIIASGAVENIILWDGNTETWAPAHGSVAVKLDDESPVTIGDKYDGTNFADQVGQIFYVPTLDELKVRKMAELGDAFTQQMLTIKAGYPADEIQSWLDQKSEALAYTANTQVSTPLLSAMAKARGLTVSDLAARVLVNALKFATAAGALIGKRQKYEDAVIAAGDPAAVDGIVWLD